MRRHHLIIPALVLLTLAAFWRVSAYGLVNFDDGYYIADNPAIQQGLTLKAVGWAFTTYSCANWHPLTWLSFMLDFQLFGLNPGEMHLVNLGCHMANVVLVYLLLAQMAAARWRSALVAALFAVHPLRVESVAWVSERKDVLCALGGLAALLAYVSYARRPSVRRYLVVVLFYVLSLLAKPMLVTLPLLLLILDYWPPRRWGAAQPIQSGSASPQVHSATVRRFPARLLLLEKLPLLALAAASSILTLAAQRHAGAVADLGQAGLSNRLGNVLVSYVRYPGKTIWFKDLIALYGYPSGGWRPWQVLGSFWLLAAATLLALHWRRSRPWLIAGWMWYLVALLPVIGLVRVGEQSIADRYTYLPGLGLLVALVWSLPAWPAGRLAGRLAYGGIIAGVLAVLAMSTWRQSGYWENGWQLWRHALDVSDDNHAAQSNFASAAMLLGQNQVALAHYARSLELDPPPPYYWIAYTNMGLIYAGQGEGAKAAAYYRRALELNPDYLQAHNNLGLLLERKGDRRGAEAEYRQALRVSRGYAAAWNNLGLLLARLGRSGEAMECFGRVIALRPDDAGAQTNLGVLLERQGRLGEAASCYRRAAELNPRDSHVQLNLGVALARLGSVQEAIAPLRRAVQLDPRDADAHYLLGLALLRTGQPVSAAGEFRLTLQIRPDHITARRQLALLENASSSATPPAGTPP